MAVDLAALGADSLAISSHKLGGPAGAGALLLAPDVAVHRAADRRRRAGARPARRHAAGARRSPGSPPPRWRPATRRRWRRCATRRSRPRWRCGRRGVRRRRAAAGQHHLRWRCPGVRADAQVIALDLDGVAVSAGAACSSGKVADQPRAGGDGARRRWPARRSACRCRGTRRTRRHRRVRGRLSRAWRRACRAATRSRSGVAAPGERSRVAAHGVRQLAIAPPVAAPSVTPRRSRPLPPRRESYITHERSRRRARTGRSIWTTRPPRAATRACWTAMLPFFTERYGNPHSVEHVMGNDAEAAVETARGQVAALLGADVQGDRVHLRRHREQQHRHQGRRPLRRAHGQRAAPRRHRRHRAQMRPGIGRRPGGRRLRAGLPAGRAPTACSTPTRCATRWPCRRCWSASWR